MTARKFLERLRNRDGETLFVILKVKTRLYTGKLGGSTIEAVHGDTAEKLGVEVCGFLGHDFAGGGDVHDLVDPARVQQEGDLGDATVDGVQGCGGFALVGQIFLGG